MRKIFFWFLAFTISVVNSQKLQGKIENGTEETKLFLRTISDRPVKEITVKDNAFTSGNLNIKPGYYILRKGNDMVYLYLKKSDDLTIIFDAKEFSETITFSGKGAEINNYLKEKRTLETQKRDDIEDYCKKGEKVYSERIKIIDKDLVSFLEESKLDTDFVIEERENLKYNYLFNVFNYKNLQNYYFGKEVTPSKAFLEPLKDVDFNNAALHDLLPSYNNLASFKWKKDIEKAKDLTAMTQLFRATKSNALKIQLLIGFYHSISNADSEEKAENYYKLIEKFVPSKEFVNGAKEKLKSIKKTAVGKKSPNFIYKDSTGKEINLESFSGKYVLIDVWATWCMPCLDQMKYLKELEYKYKNKNIVFIGISVDKEAQYETWKETIVTKELKSIQLFADNSFDSEFIKAYAISSIPRFILISPEGKIIKNKMSKPSEEKTVELLDSLLQ